jgi:hypothetical protein
VPDPVAEEDAAVCGGAPVAALAVQPLPLVQECQVPCVRTHGPRILTLSAADHAARAAGMPFGGGFRSSHTGLEVAMSAPVEETT